MPWPSQLRVWSENIGQRPTCTLDHLARTYALAWSDTAGYTFQHGAPGAHSSGQCGAQHHSGISCPTEFLVHLAPDLIYLICPSPYLRVGKGPAHVVLLDPRGTEDGLAEGVLRALLADLDGPADGLLVRPEARRELPSA